MLVQIETLDGRTLDLRAYAAERGVTRARMYQRSVPAGPGLRRETPPAPPGARRHTRVRTCDGRVLLVQDYTAELGLRRASLYSGTRLAWDAQAGLWVERPPYQTGHPRKRDAA